MKLILNNVRTRQLRSARGPLSRHCANRLPCMQDITLFSDVSVQSSWQNYPEINLSKLVLSENSWNICIFFTRNLL